MEQLFKPSRPSLQSPEWQILTTHGHRNANFTHSNTLCWAIPREAGFSFTQPTRSAVLFPHKEQDTGTLVSLDTTHSDGLFLHNELTVGALVSPKPTHSHGIFLSEKQATKTIVAPNPNSLCWVIPARGAGYGNRLHAG